jgi:hypothetical protein
MQIYQGTFFLACYILKQRQSSIALQCSIYSLVALLAVLWQVFFPDTYFNYRPSASKNQASQKVDSPKNSLLEKTCDLLRNFPEYMDVVVSVARKTDGRHWADLFSTAGRSTE